MASSSAVTAIVERLYEQSKKAQKMAEKKKQPKPKKPKKEKKGCSLTSGWLH